MTFQPLISLETDVCYEASVSAPAYQQRWVGLVHLCVSTDDTTAGCDRVLVLQAMPYCMTMLVLYCRHGCTV